MAMQTRTAWEVRTTGANTNGASFYDIDPGTSVDYSQQDSAELALTDLVSDGAGTGITSATGGFTAAMAGNGIYIAGGTGFTTGWYQIVTYTDTNTIVIDRSAGASKTGGTGNVGGAYKIGTIAVDNVWQTTSQFGTSNYIHIKAGTYTMDGTIACGGWRCSWRGYNTTRGDKPEGTNRPLINSASGYWNVTVNGQHYQNIRWDNTWANTAAAVYLGTSAAGSGLVNCYVRKQHNSSSSEGVRMAGLQQTVAACEIVCDYGLGVVISGARACIYGSYLNAAVYGIQYSGSGGTSSVAVGNVTNGSGGIRLYNYGTVINNTIYATGAVGVKGIYVNSGGQVFNNIIHGTTGTLDGVRITTNYLSENNHIYNCDTYDSQESGDFIFPERDTTVDPGLEDPGSGDFTLGSGADAFDFGMGLAQTSLEV